MDEWAGPVGMPSVAVSTMSLNIRARRIPYAKQTGVILHLQARSESQEEPAPRRLMVPSETAAHAQAFKYKLEQALLAWQSAAGRSGSRAQGRG